MQIQRFLKQKIKQQEDEGIFRVLERVRCKDGYSVSVQVGFGAYSKPRKRCSEIDYICAELGFPSEEDKLISKYAEDEENLKHTVYPYVPIFVIEELVKKHGGIVNMDLS